LLDASRDRAALAEVVRVENKDSSARYPQHLSHDQIRAGNVMQNREGADEVKLPVFKA
jgi:hypothetical protein